MNLLYFTVLFSSTINCSILNLNLESFENINLAKQCEKHVAHDYLKVYERYFSTIRTEPITFLEIGFFQGESAQLWEQYFPHADLYFIDINPICFEYFKRRNLSKRSHLYLVNQESKKDLKDFIKKVDGEFDVIIDDGGHTVNQQKTSFEILFPALKSGGVYIIEDLHTSYWKRFGGAGEPGNPKAAISSTTEFLKNLVDDINYGAAYTGYANRAYSKNILKQFTYYQKHIESIHFYGSLCCIFKR